MTAKIYDFTTIKALRDAGLEKSNADRQPWRSMDDLPPVDSTFDLREVIGEVHVNETEAGRIDGH